MIPLRRMVSLAVCLGEGLLHCCVPVDDGFIVGDDGRPLRQKGDGYSSEPYVDLCECGVVSHCGASK